MPRDLERLQRWLQNVITHPSGIVSGIESPHAREEIDIVPEEIETVIHRSRDLDSIGRLEVYGNAYYARLLECLEEEYSAVAHAVGEETFTTFVWEYLQVSPSRSYTLARLGVDFPEFLRQTRPPRDPDEGPGPDWADFLIDLATLERLYSDVFDGPGTERIPPLTAGDFQAIPPEVWPDVKLTPAACLRLISLRFPVHEYITALREEREPQIPDPEPTWLAITRRHFVVRRIPATYVQYVLLESLSAGLPVGAAIECAAEHVDDLDQFAADLQSWFQEWSAARLFVGLELPQNAGN